MLGVGMISCMVRLCWVAVMGWCAISYMARL